jgi:acylphosphatase
MNNRLHVVFSGRVQGVGFRFTAESAAHALGVMGWVRNLKSGEVEVVAEAPDQALRDFLARLEEHFSGYIQDRKISWEAARGEFKGFSVRF